MTFEKFNIFCKEKEVSNCIFCGEKTENLSKACTECIKKYEEIFSPQLQIIEIEESN